MCASIVILSVVVVISLSVATIALCEFARLAREPARSRFFLSRQSVVCGFVLRFCDKFRVTARSECFLHLYLFELGVTEVMQALILDGVFLFLPYQELILYENNVQTR